MVDNLVAYFEQLSDPMDLEKPRSARKITRNATGGTGSSKVKRILNDITEIKRPPGKHKPSMDNIREEAKTQQRSKGKKNDNQLHHDNQIKTTNNTINRNDYKKNKLASVTHEHDETEMLNLHTKCDVIEKKVEEFGENLKKKRIQFEDQHEKRNAGIENNGVTNLQSYRSGQIIDKSEPESYITFENEDDLSDEDNYQRCLVYNDSIHEKGEMSDDMFGFNDFDEDQNNNYIIETYNREGGELIITTLQITRRIITSCRSEYDISSLSENFDYVFRLSDDNSDNNSDSKNSNSDDFYETSNSFPKFETDNSSSNNVNILHENHHENNEIFEIQTPPEYLVYNEKREEGDNYYINVDNFTDVQDVIDSASNDTPSDKLTNRSKITYTLEELIKTEEQYITGLEIVVNDYIPYIKKHITMDLLGKDMYIFGNIVDIYKNAKEFLQSLKQSDKNVNDIAEIFIDHKSAFTLYPLYSKNKPRADNYLKFFEEIVKRRQRELKDRLGLASYLLTPIQRLGKYVLLLEQIQKELKRIGEPFQKVNEAIDVIRKVMRQGNDFIAVDSITNCDINLILYGSFIMRASFTILKPRKFVSMVFLFENIIVFTEKTPKTVEYFKYVDSIQMSDLSLGKFEEKPTIFHLTNYTKSKKGALSDATYILEAESSRQKNEWTSAIEKKLWDQLEKAKAQQTMIPLPDYRHGPKYNKPKSSSLPRPIKKKNRKTYESFKSKSKFYASDSSR